MEFTKMRRGSFQRSGSGRLCCVIVGDQSAIEWTDATWNPVTGCTKISPGCKHCYAERLAARLRAMGNPRYGTARKGVTGRKTDLSQGVAAFLERCGTAASLPLGLGFGIRTAADVREMRGLANIAIVGTGISRCGRSAVRTAIGSS
jgi:hypothetical protein